MQDSKDRVQWIYSSTSNQELQERYDQWAAEYDKDLAEEFAWNAPQTAVDLFRQARLHRGKGPRRGGPALGWWVSALCSRGTKTSTP